MSAQEATWEVLEDMKVNFPDLNLEDKVLLKGDGIVMRQTKGKGLEGVESSNEEGRVPPRVQEGKERRKSNRIHKPNTTLKDFITT